MSLLDKRTASDLTKLVAFMVITAVFTSVLVLIIGNVTFGAKREYKAVFVDATGVVKGDDIRIAGVKVGSVSDVKIQDRTRALVTFTVDEDARVTDATHVSIRFRNLVGQRYLSLSQELGGTSRLDDGETIPVEKTSPALDLTVLFNGFKPLFRALSPSDLNKLSYEIIQVFQGEGGTLESLLAHTASVTSTLAGRDEIIGELIENLNDTLVHIGSRDDELSDLIGSFRTLVSGLKKDRFAILDSLDSISDLSVETAELVSGVRPDLLADIKELRRLTTQLDKDKGELDRALQVMPIKLEKIGRTAAYGSWFNFYICEFKAHVKLPAGQELPLDFKLSGERCDLG